MVKQMRINKKGSENQLPFLLRGGETFMYITADTIITAAGVFGALLTISTLFYKVVQWLQEQGCNGPVNDAVGKVEKHLNQKAHKDYSG